MVKKVLPMKAALLQTSKTEFHRQISVLRMVADDDSRAPRSTQWNFIGKLMSRESLPMKRACR